MLVEICNEKKERKSKILLGTELCETVSVRIFRSCGLHKLALLFALFSVCLVFSLSLNRGVAQKKKNTVQQLRRLGWLYLTSGGPSQRGERRSTKNCGRAARKSEWAGGGSRGDGSEGGGRAGREEEEEKKKPRLRGPSLTRGRGWPVWKQLNAA